MMRGAAKRRRPDGGLGQLSNTAVLQSSATFGTTRLDSMLFLQRLTEEGRVGEHSTLWAHIFWEDIFEVGRLETMAEW